MIPRPSCPTTLRTLAGVGREVELHVEAPPTLRLDPQRAGGQLPGAPGHGPGPDDKTSPPAFIRFFACEEDLSHEPADVLLPEAVANGAEPLHVVGAMAGG